jgi:hypothetical protein
MKQLPPDQESAAANRPRYQMLPAIGSITYGSDLIYRMGTPHLIQIAQNRLDGSSRFWLGKSPQADRSHTQPIRRPQDHPPSDGATGGGALLHGGAMPASGRTGAQVGEILHGRVLYV